MNPIFIIQTINSINSPTNLFIINCYLVSMDRNRVTSIVLVTLFFMMPLSLFQSTSGLGLSDNDYSYLTQQIEEKYSYVKSIVVTTNGDLTYEYYSSIHDSASLFDWYSVAKSIASILVGIAIDQGYISSVNVKMMDYFNQSEIENWDPLKADITIKHLLQMQSGFEWGGFASAPFSSLFASSNWTYYLLERDMREPPGTSFDYDDGASHLLMAIVSEASGMSTQDFADQYLFDPLEIDYTWDESPEGVFAGFYRLVMSTPHMARIGAMLLDEGVWEGDQIISSEYISEAIYTHYAPEFPTDYTSWNWDDRKEVFTHYGYQWWVIPDTFQYPIYTAFGAFGQYLALIPDEDAVVSITAQASTFFFVDIFANEIFPVLNNTYSSTNDSDSDQVAYTFLSIIGGILVLPKLKGRIINQNDIL